LILEYAVGNMAVAKGWSDYFVKLLYSLSHGAIKLPLWLVTDPTTAATKVSQGGEAAQYYSPLSLPHILGYPIALDLPALLIVAAVTVLLIYGIRESATTNTTIVLIKVAVVVFVIAFGAFMVHPTNWRPFAPSGFGGIMSGAAIVFFCLHRFRCRLHHRGGNQESATRSADWDDRQSHHLHPAVCAHGGRAHRHQKIHGLSR